MALATSVIAQVASLSVGDGRTSTWELNGSTLALFVNGPHRQFKYDIPRPGMLDEGVRSGTLLFEGIAGAGRYSGKAFVFSKRCGVFPYAVAGPISPDFRNVTMYGKAPQVDENCRVAAHKDMVLRFGFRQAAPPPVVVAQPSSPPVQADVPDYAIWRENAELKQRLAVAEQQRRTAELIASNAQARISTSEARLADLQRELAMVTHLSGSSSPSVSPSERAKPNIIIEKNSPTAGVLGGLGSAGVVALFSIAFEIVKSLLKKREGPELSRQSRFHKFLRELLIESGAAIISTGVLAYFGWTDEWKIALIPLGFGLSVAVLLSAKHAIQSDSAHGHHSHAYA